MNCCPGCCSKRKCNAANTQTKETVCSENRIRRKDPHAKRLSGYAGRSAVCGSSAYFCGLAFVHPFFLYRCSAIWTSWYSPMAMAHRIRMEVISISSWKTWLA